MVRQELAESKGIPQRVRTSASRDKRSKPVDLKLEDLPAPGSRPFAKLWASLTPKQQVFVNTIVDLGARPSEAYRIAYDAGKSSGKTVYEEASRMRHHRKIAPVIEARLTHQRQWTGKAEDAPEIRETSLRVLREIAEQGQMEACRVRSAELLGKVTTVGLFTERSEVVQRSEHSPEAQIELASRLSALLDTVEPVQLIDSTGAIDCIAVPVLGAATDPPTDPELDLGAGI
jgi:hypothetical protein